MSERCCNQSNHVSAFPGYGREKCPKCKNSYIHSSEKSANKVPHGYENLSSAQQAQIKHTRPELFKELVDRIDNFVFKGKFPHLDKNKPEDQIDINELKYGRPGKRDLPKK
jgi:hypothetical protein